MASSHIVEVIETDNNDYVVYCAYLPLVKSRGHSRATGMHIASRHSARAAVSFFTASTH